MTSLGTLLLRLEIIAVTYRSTIFKTHVFSLYSHLSIKRDTPLHTAMAGLAAGGTCEQFEVRLKMTIL